MKKTILMISTIFLALAFAALGAVAQSPDLPTLLTSVKNTTTLSFCEEPVPMENQEVLERLEKELMLTAGNRPQVLLWLKRSRRYLPVIEKMLKENSMPQDFKYMAIAESALQPHVGSNKGAIGFWQIMPDTGRKYGLKIDPTIDERRSLSASTRAAIEYLKELHEWTGSWTLAAAAYNMGEQGLAAEMMVQHTDDYYQLYLPLETQRFVFRIIAAKLILSDPAKFGFHLEDHDYYPPLEFDEIRIDCFQEVPISLVAKASDTHFKVIKDLNPEIRGHYLTEGTHVILIPKGAKKGFVERYHKLVKDYEAEKTNRIYIVKPGDNLSSISEKFEVPLTALMIWNRLDLNRPIHPGDRLIIYPENSVFGLDK